MTPDEENNQSILETGASKSQAKHPMEALLKQNGGNMFPRVGEIVEGVFLERQGNRIFIDLGPIGTGIIYGREYYAAQDIIKNLQPGDQVNSKVVETDNEEGYIELSLKDAGEEQRWIELKKLMQTGEIIELPALEANRGGLIIELRNVKGFLPASQLSSKNYPRVDGGDKEKIFQELQKLIGQKLKVRVLDVDPRENKLIFTEKDSNQEAAREIFSKFKVGDEIEGEITSVVDFGAFMRPEGTHMEGLIHISEIDWTLIEDPRELLKPGDKVKTKIIDLQGDKMSLSLRALKENPWPKITEKYNKGDTVKGKVSKLNPFGAFVRLDQDFHGLIHISEFGTEENMKKEIEVGKEYDLKILMVDPAEHRIALGIIREEKPRLSEEKSQSLEKKSALSDPVIVSAEQKKEITS